MGDAGVSYLHQPTGPVLLRTLAEHQRIMHRLRAMRLNSNLLRQQFCAAGELVCLAAQRSLRTNLRWSAATLAESLRDFRYH